MVVADWSQAKIGYTAAQGHQHRYKVADWSQAKIGYTQRHFQRLMPTVADWSQAKIGYTDPTVPVTLPVLRIGLRPRLVTLCE